MAWSDTIYHPQNERYYKYKDSWNGPDILDADTPSALERRSREFHDHLFKRSGVVLTG